MKTQEHPFTGIWHVVRQEYRALGEWKQEYVFEPGEWLVAFCPDGRYGEIRRFTDDSPTTGAWTLDTSTGIISIQYNETPGCIYSNGRMRISTPEPAISFSSFARSVL